MTDLFDHMAGPATPSSAKASQVRSRSRFAALSAREILPARGENPTKENEQLYRVTDIISEAGELWANVVAIDELDEEWAVRVDDLVVVAEFRDPIYPGLVSTGKIERGGDKPFHTASLTIP